MLQGQIRATPASLERPVSCGRGTVWFARILVVLGVLSCLVITAGTNARPASALMPKPIPITLPGVAVSTAAAAGSSAAAGALAAGAFAAGFYGSTALLNFAFGPKGDDRSRALLNDPRFGWLSPADTTGPRSGGVWDLAIREVIPGGMYVTIQARCWTGPGARGPYSTFRENDFTGGNQGNYNAAAGNYGTAGIAFGGGTCPFDAAGRDGIADVMFRQGGLTGPVIAVWSFAPPVTSWNVDVVTRCVSPTATELHTVSRVVPVVAGAARTLEGSNCSAVMPGSHAENVSASGGAPGDQGTIVSQDVWTPGTAEAYPLCTTGSGAAPTCQLVPKVNGRNCLTEEVECGGWSTRGGRSCTWGSYVVPDAWCTSAYGEFLAQASTGPAVNPGTDPAAPVPGTLGQGTTVTNPDGSTTATQSQTLPDGQTRTVTTTTRPDGSRTVTTQPTNPDGTVRGAPTVVQLPAPGGGTTTPEQGGSCLSGAFSLNPVDWVYVPVRCALSWAFVPSQASLAAANATASAGWQSTGITAWGTAVGDVGGGLVGVGASAAGCAGPHFSFTLKGTSYDFDPLNACSQPMQGVAVVVKVLISLAVIVAGVRLCARPIMASFGMNGAV